MVIDGREIARKIIDDLKKQKRLEKILAVVLVGDNPQSLSFVKQKEKIAKELGIKFNLIGLGGQISEGGLIAEINKLNNDNAVGGIILQLPLPPHINRDRVVPAIIPQKDVDALNPENNLVLAPAVEVVKDILNAKRYTLNAKIVAVVGAKGFLVGRPITEYLKGKCGKLISLDIGDDLAQIKKVDLVITGVGKAGLIKSEMLKKGAAVIDFGYSIKSELGIGNKESSNKIFGDLDISDTHNSLFAIHDSGFYTPTPGGTGPILVAEIFRNFYKLNFIAK